MRRGRSRTAGHRPRRFGLFRGQDEQLALRRAQFGHIEFLALLQHGNEPCCLRMTLQHVQGGGFGGAAHGRSCARAGTGTGARAVTGSETGSGSGGSRGRCSRSRCAGRRHSGNGSSGNRLCSRRPWWRSPRYSGSRWQRGRRRRGWRRRQGGEGRWLGRAWSLLFQRIRRRGRYPGCARGGRCRGWYRRRSRKRARILRRCRR